MQIDDFCSRASEAIFNYEEPMTYLRNRGISDEDIRKYQLGYVRIARFKDDGSEEYKRLQKSTFGFKTLEKRIVFPLRNVAGRVNGVQVRDLQKKMYVIYLLDEAKKIGTLFGFREALPHIAKTRKVFVHEGGFNAISFAKVFPNSISSLTSFLNELQYETLKFFCDRIVLVYDKDKAGLDGLRKAQEYYQDSCLETVFMGDSDSNAMYCTLGPQRFERFVRSKVPTLLQD